MKSQLNFLESGFYKTITIVLLITLSAHSCEKEKSEPTLPPETKEGKNSFGCYINDKLFRWQRGSAGFANPSLAANYKKSTQSLVISASSRTGSVRLRVLNPGVRKIIPQSVEYTTGRYTYEAQNTGEIFFTRFDLNNRIISGTFACEIQIYDDDGNVKETIKFTQGRFDIKMRDYNIRD